MDGEKDTSPWIRRPNVQAVIFSYVISFPGFNCCMKSWRIRISLNIKLCITSTWYFVLYTQRKAFMVIAPSDAYYIHVCCITYLVRQLCDRCI